MLNLPFTLFATDVVAAVLSYMLGHYIRLSMMTGVPYVWPELFPAVIIYVSAVIFSIYFCELYGRERNISSVELVACVSVTTMVAFFQLSVVYYAFPELVMGRGVLALSLLICGVMLCLIRWVYQSLCKHPRFARNVLVVGVGQLAETIRDTIQTSPYNYVFAGFVEPQNGREVSLDERVIGHLNQIEKLVEQGDIHKLVVSVTEQRGVLPVKALLTCKLRGVEIFDSPSFYEKLTNKLLIDNIFSCLKKGGFSPVEIIEPKSQFKNQ